jgi:hypothetical protein
MVEQSDSKIARIGTVFQSLREVVRTGCQNRLNWQFCLIGDLFVSGGLGFLVISGGFDPWCRSSVNPVDRDGVLFDTACFEWLSVNSPAGWILVLPATGK